MTRWVKISAVAAISVALLGAAIAQGCGGGAVQAPEQTREALPPNQLVTRALKIFASDIPTGDFPNNSISGVKLSSMLAGGQEKSTVFLLDTRDRADFDKGHIEGSTQVDFAKWAAPENLAKYPKDKKIVVIDYLDDYGGQVTGGLRMLGYDAVALRGGINGWAQGFLQPQITLELANTDYPVETTPGEAFVPAPEGIVFDAPSDADYRVLAEKANSIFSGQPAGEYNVITAGELNTLLDTGEGAKVFVLDIRQRVDFNQGHIKGAVNIPFQALGTLENLQRLPKDKKIVVVCAFASSAGQVMTTLRMLDYNVVMLKFSMTSWNGFGKKTFLEYIQTANNPVVQSP